MSQFNQLIVDFVTERNNENLVMVETVNKEIKGWSTPHKAWCASSFGKNLVLYY